MKLTEIKALAERIANLRSDEFGHDVSATESWLSENADTLAEQTLKLVEWVQSVQYYTNNGDYRDWKTANKSTGIEID